VIELDQLDFEFSINITILDVITYNLLSMM
jgi:hypothetical protein